MSLEDNITLTSYDPALAINASCDPPKLVPFTKIESTLVSLLSENAGVEAIFSSQERAFRQSTLEAREKGISSSLPIQTAGQPPQPKMTAGAGAQVCIKSGYTKDGDNLVSKVAAGGGDDTGNTGVVFVFDQKTLRLSNILCDEGLLTEVRTAAACAYASRLLLGDRRHEIGKIGIVGGGVQAVWQLRLLGAGVVSKLCRKIIIKTRSRESADAFIQRMKASSYPPDREWEFEHYQPVASGGDGFRQCRLIHTLTQSRAPVLTLDDIHVPDEDADQFLHITAVGADSPGKRELDHDLIRKADELICDSIPQSKVRGEFQSEEFWENLQEIGSMTSREATSSSKFIIFDSSGLPLQDVEMANLVSQSLI